MQVDFSRDQAADLLLGRTPLNPDALASTPPFLRRRVARRAAVKVLAEATRLSAFELGALVHAATADSDAHVRLSAVQALALAAPPGLSASLLIACTTDGDEAVRAAAQQALSRLEKDAARVVPLLRAVSPAESASHTKVPAFIGH